MRLKKIISVYGGRAASVQAFCDTLLNALEMARKKLRCSFTGLDGRDISEDIRVKLVEKPPGSQPRSYRFVKHVYRRNFSVSYTGMLGKKNPSCPKAVLNYSEKLIN